MGFWLTNNEASVARFSAVDYTDSHTIRTVESAHQNLLIFATQGSYPKHLKLPWHAFADDQADKLFSGFRVFVLRVQGYSACDLISTIGISIEKG